MASLHRIKYQCLFHPLLELKLTNMITALDIEIQCVDRTDSDVEYSVVVIYDQAPINIGEEKDAN
mgnify:FL=1